MSTTVNLAATEDGETAVLGVPLGDLIISLIGFSLLLFVVWKFIAPAFEKAYAARTAAIEGGLAKAEEAQEQAARALEQYNRQLATARDEAAKIREEARTAAQAIRDDVLAQAHAESDRIAAQGRTQLEAQRQQILQELRADLGRTSVELASRIVGESLTDEARRQRTVERFLAELER